MSNRALAEDFAPPHTTGKKKSVPPQPAMFQLHAPIIAAPPADDRGVTTAEDIGIEKPAVNSTNEPTTGTSIKGNTDTASLDMKPSAATKKGGKKDDNESDKDSITMEINNTSPPTSSTQPDSPKNKSNQSSNRKTAKQNNETNPAATKTGDLLQDSDNDDEATAFPKTAIKRPRNTASAEAYAKRMREKEEAKKKGGLEEGTGTNKRGATSKSEEGNNNKESSSPSKKNTSKKLGGNSKSKAGEEAEGDTGGSTNKKGRGHVKTKHTPKVANDIPPPKKSSYRSKLSSLYTTSEDAAEAPAGLKSPPEEIVEESSSRRSTRASRRSTGSAASGGDLKSPPEEMEESHLKSRAGGRRGKRDKTSPAPKTKGGKKSPPSLEGARRSSRRNTSAVAEELVPNLKEESKRKRDEDEDEELSTGRPKRSRMPSLEAQEAIKNENAAVTVAAASNTVKKSPKQSKVPPKRKSVAKKTKSPKKAPNLDYLQAKIDKTFQERLKMLKAHKNKYQACDLTLARLAGDPVDPLLRGFVMESRKQYKKFHKGEHSTLTMAKISEMEKLGFDFEPTKTGGTRNNHDLRFQQQWEDNFDALKKYKAKHGDCLVSCVDKNEDNKKVSVLVELVDIVAARPDSRIITTLIYTRYTSNILQCVVMLHPSLLQLGNWVRGQRKLMNKSGRKGFVPDRLKRLEELGFDWDPMRSKKFMESKRQRMFPRIDANWQKKYNALLQYKEKHGNIIIGPSAKGWPGLYDWVHVQRKEYKKYQAGDEKALMYEQWVEKLNEIGFQWAPMKGDAFSKMLKERQSKHYDGLWHKHYK